MTPYRYHPTQPIPTRAIRCKKCEKMLRFGHAPTLYRLCDACFARRPWWHDCAPELTAVGVVAAGCGLWLVMALMGVFGK